MSEIQTKPNKNLMDNNTMIRKLAKDEIKCNQYTYFYEKPRVRGSGSTFLRIPEFESQKFLKFIKIQYLVS